MADIIVTPVNIEPVVIEPEVEEKPAEETENEVETPEVVVEPELKIEAPNVEDYNNLFEKYSAQTAEVEKWKAMSRKHEAANKALFLEKTKTDIMNELGLPEAAASLIEGKTEEVIRGKAESLKALFNIANPSTQQQDVLPPKPAAKPLNLQGVLNENGNSSDDTAAIVAQVTKKLNEKYK